MSKVHTIKMEEQVQAPEGGDIPAQGEEQSTEPEAGAI